MEYQNDLNHALKFKEANKKLVEKIKRKKPKDLDDKIHQLHDLVFEDIDCLKCANCCKTTSPIFYMKDIERAAQALKQKPAQFIQNYLHLDDDKDYVLNSTPCPFLDHENYCTIYKDRPTACREYPHTNRKKMVQIMDLTLTNSLICPAVARIFKLISI